MSIDANKISLTSLAITLISILWHVFYGYGQLNGRIDAQQEDIHEVKAAIMRLEEKMDKGFEKIEKKFEKLEEKLDQRDAEYHQMDIRLTKVEERKH